MNNLDLEEKVEAFAQECRDNYPVYKFEVFYDADEKALILDTIVVKEDSRGKGVGKELVRKVQALARSLGLRVKLNPDKRSPDYYNRLIKYYEDLGFKKAPKNKPLYEMVSAGRISYRNADLLKRVRETTPVEFFVTFEADQNYSLEDHTLVIYRGVDAIKEWESVKDPVDMYFRINEKRSLLEDLVKQSFEKRAKLDKMHADNREAGKGIGFHLFRNEWVRQVKSEEDLVIQSIGVVKNEMPHDEDVVSIGNVMQLSNNSAMYGFKVSVK